MKLEETLHQIELVMNQWQVYPREWYFIGEAALQVAGYDMPWEPLAMDIGVLRERLDWASKHTGERSMLPPAGSMEFETYIRCVTTIEKSLEIFAAESIPEKLTEFTFGKSKYYALDAKDQINFYLNSVKNTEKLAKFSPSKKERWAQRADFLWRKAIEKNNTEIAKICEEMLRILQKS